LGISPQAIVAQVLLGLINGSFYAVLSLGLAIIFGLLNIVNFVHGAQFMVGAFVAWLGLMKLGAWIGFPEFRIGYFASLIVAPVVVGLGALAFERLLLRRLYKLSPEYGLLLTFGLALVLEGLFRHFFGVSGKAYEVPSVLTGLVRFESIEIAIPIYRLWAVGISLAACGLTWWMFERTRLGALLKAGTQNAALLQSFGVNVPVLVSFAYVFGVALAAFAGVVAAPVYQVSPMMGSNLLIVVLAVVVIGGIGSIFGAIVTGLGMGVLEGLTKVFYPEASAVVIFFAMAVVLIFKPAGLFGRDHS
jgi:branched-chain amino acid transport system permease protein